MRELNVNVVIPVQVPNLFWGKHVNLLKINYKYFTKYWAQTTLWKRAIQKDIQSSRVANAIWYNQFSEHLSKLYSSLWVYIFSACLPHQAVNSTRAGTLFLLLLCPQQLTHFRNSMSIFNRMKESFILQVREAARRLGRIGSRMVWLGKITEKNCCIVRDSIVLPFSCFQCLY